MTRINVTKTYLPPIDKYKSYIDKIWDNGFLTNGAPFLVELETRLKSFLGTPHFYFVTNGTLALQLALRSLDITEGEVITTPFSYVATTSSILRERCKPVFVDIDANTFCIDPTKIEQAITPETRAIMAVHVFGYPCDIAAIEAIAKRHHLKVIYDGAHVFGCQYKGRSLLDYGDIATGSFHSTKVFHTIEGGCVIAHSPEIGRKISLLRSFGHIYDDYFELGINAKASEFQAVMGLCNLDDFAQIVADRKIISDLYTNLLPSKKIQWPEMPEDFIYNYSYYPVVFETAAICNKVIEKLKAHDIYPRRYFWPSLNTLPYLEETQSCPISESISNRVLCLPLHPSLELSIVEKIAKLISDVVNDDQ